MKLRIKLAKLLAPIRVPEIIEVKMIEMPEIIEIKL